MNKTFACLILIFSSLLFFTGCSSVRVSQDYALNYSFSDPKSYNWATELQSQQEGLQNENELLANRFTQSINRALTRQGFIISSTPSYLLTYSYTVATKMKSDLHSPAFSFGFGRYGRYGGLGINSGNTIRQYDEGKLQIYLYHGQSKELLWKGVGTMEVYTHSNPKDTIRKIDEMVTTILKQFPPSPTSR